MEVRITYTNFKTPDVETQYCTVFVAPMASSVIYHFVYIYCITTPSFKKKARKRHFVAPNQACHVTAANPTLAMATRDTLLSTRIIIELDRVLSSMISMEHKNTTGHIALRRHCCSFLNKCGFQKEMIGFRTDKEGPIVDPGTHLPNVCGSRRRFNSTAHFRIASR
jgi:hypothetical protein